MWSPTCPAGLANDRHPTARAALAGVEEIMRRPFTALGVVLLAACSTSAQPAKSQPAPSDIVATVGTRSFTLADVDERALKEAAASFGNARLGQALYLA